MGPELWLAIGIGAAAALLGGGYLAGWTARDEAADEREARLEAEIAALVGQIDEALAQGVDGAEAARLVVDGARRRAAALAAADPRARRRLLLGASLGDPPPPAPGQAGGPDSAAPAA